jgi:hypothetical protein
MPTSQDQDPVVALRSHGTNPSLGICIGTRSPNRCEDDPSALRAEDLVEAGGELRVAITDEELYGPIPVIELDHEVAGHLGDPGTGRVGSHPQDVNHPAVEFDHEQHVEAPEPHRVDGEEIDSEGGSRLSSEELDP